ncbi:hypothetical protein GCM10009000_008760 [Halobacterium noricense]|uniref:GS catalytic domain-containing protein n=1 Tax=Haladaptatus pallidirubidus TaxID=1008152 RepID=A0AAV3UQG0_9EURY
MLKSVLAEAEHGLHRQLRSRTRIFLFETDEEGRATTTPHDPGDPVREDIYEFDDEKREEYGITTLPGSLGKAVDEFECDGVITEALGEHVTEKIVEAKRADWADYKTHVSIWKNGGISKNFDRGSFTTLI